MLFMDTQSYHDGIIDWVESQAGENAPTTVLGSVFCQWCLENVFDLSTDEALDAQEVGGAFDHGIDAFITSQDNNLIVVQTKYGTAHSFSQATKFHYDMERILKNKVREFDANDVAYRIIVNIQDAYQKDRAVKFYYITSSTFSELDASKIKQMDGYNENYYFYDLPAIADLLERKQEDIPATLKDRWLTLNLSTREILKFADTTAVIAVRLVDMHKFVEQGGNDLFVSNVRQYLRTKINTGIRDTIIKSPEHFWLYNNGITIVCDDFLEENFRIKIKTPQIVNGCQTAKSIWEVLSKRWEAERKEIPGHVLVRIIKGANEIEKENITRYTNTQNAVRGKDFFSLEQFQRKLQKRFKHLGYFYEIQRGSFTALKPSERAKYVGKPELAYLVDEKFKNLIPALESVQAFASGFRQLPAIAYGVPYELAPGGSWYEKIFEESLEPESKLFLYPYLIREWARNNGYSRGGEGGWRAHSALFFVYTYFTTVLEILKRIGVIDPLETSPEQISMSIWDALFCFSELNLELLYTTDEILDRYFSDSKVDDAVGLDVRKFLKSQDTLTRYKGILIRLIEIVSSRKARLMEMFESMDYLT